MDEIIYERDKKLLSAFIQLSNYTLDGAYNGIEEMKKEVENEKNPNEIKKLLYSRLKETEKYVRIIEENRDDFS